MPPFNECVHNIAGQMVKMFCGHVLHVLKFRMSRDYPCKNDSEELASVQKYLEVTLLGNQYIELTYPQVEPPPRGEFTAWFAKISSGTTIPVPAVNVTFWDDDYSRAQQAEPLTVYTLAAGNALTSPHIDC